MGFLRLILIFLVIYFVAKLLSRVFFTPSTGNSGSSGEQKKKEGEVTIDNSATNRKKQISKDEGEYIDYEEVKDN
mgnify:CR=1 FL=1